MKTQTLHKRGFRFGFSSQKFITCSVTQTDLPSTGFHFAPTEKNKKNLTYICILRL